MDSALSNVLLAVYRLARGVPAAQFEAASLGTMREYLPFERGEWRVSACELEEDATGSGLRRRTLVSRWCDPLVQVWTWIALHRGPKAPAFSERERRLKRLLVPHLVEAWNANAILYADRAGAEREPARQRALVDGEGVIHSFEPGFAGMLLLDFPGWRGPRLPQVLAHPLLAREAEVYRGAAIAVARLRDTAAGLRLVAARRIAAADRLSAREHAVAQAYAAGRTHKEIAAESGISPATVRNQLQAAYAKLGVSSKIELARRLGEEG